MLEAAVKEIFIQAQKEGADQLKLAQILKGQVDVLRQAGLKDVPFPRPVEKTLPQIEVRVEEPEWQRQAQNFVRLGYHAELGMAEEEYLNSLARFEPQPNEYRGKLDLPLLWETRIPWQRQAKLAGIAIEPHLQEKEEKGEVKPLSGQVEILGVSCTGWFSRRKRFSQPISPFDARVQLAEYECGAGPYEGTAYEVHSLKIAKAAKYYDLIGYTVEPDGVPALRRWGDNPRFLIHWGNRISDGWRPLTRGSKIVTK